MEAKEIEELRGIYSRLKEVWADREIGPMLPHDWLDDFHNFLKKMMGAKK